MENHNSLTVISRYLARQGGRLGALALLACGWTAAWAQFNQTQTSIGSNNYGSNGYGSNGYGSNGYGSNGYGSNGYDNGYGSNGYGGSGYGGYGSSGYGGYGSSGYGSSGYGSSFGSGSSSFGSGSSRFGSGSSSFGSGSSRFGQRSSRNRNGSDDSSTDSQSSRSRRRKNSDQNDSSSRNKNKKDKSKTGKTGDTQTQQSNRQKGKTNVSQRKTTSDKGGGGGANAVPLPQIKYDPKQIEDALYFTPSFANVAPGDQFITTIAYYNSQNHRVDEVDLWIKYNPKQVEPVWADTSKLTDLHAGPIESRIWSDLGYLHLATKLASPPKGFTSELADIHWKALTPTLESRIELAGPAGKVAAIREAGANLVEGKNGACSQKVCATIAITPLDWEEPGMRTSDQVDAMTVAAPLGKAERLRLALVSPRREVATGEVATADVMLLNPSALALDELKMRIRFNPDEVTILDADQDNFIADGLNIYDGNFHQQFPFDGHIRNQVDLDHGVIDYQVCSVMGPRVFPTGTFARIVYRMKRSAGKAAFWFEAEDPQLRVRQTDVTARGRSLLGDDTATATQALHGMEIAVKPLDLKALDGKLKTLETAAKLK